MFCVSQVSFGFLMWPRNDLEIILPLLPKCWGYRYVPLCPVYGGCWRNQNQRFMHASQALHQDTPSSICSAVWIVGLRGEGWWGRCALCAVCSLREAEGSLGTRPLPGMAVSTRLGALFMCEGQVHVYCLHASHSGYFVNPLGQYGLASFTIWKKLSLETERWSTEAKPQFP